ncbi:15528_t:CDS:2 [Funneliformis mosseae]|uniref:15528_t:CDS:1 n=1 Tax=Funneliformis mosseae TaxID=27381 RepID=A0A9N8V1T8_FUNMO|nr:15528_t:CDS:2 [Funneliformis mosseae]
MSSQEKTLNSDITHVITLTPEQIKRIENNRLKALALREKQKQQEHNNSTSRTEQKDIQGTTTNNEDNTEEKKLRPMKKFQNYAEYDFSKMKDTRGGFLLEEENENSKKRKWEPPEPEFDALEPSISIDPAENPKCKECHSLELDNLFRKTFKVNVCKKSELKDVEVLPHLSKPNPHKATWNNMMLFLREQVEEFAFKKWGGEEGLDQEYERREDIKKKRKDKKFKTKLAGKTEILEKNRRKEHKHEFGEVEEDTETGATTQCCKTCGLRIEIDVF